MIDNAIHLITFLVGVVLLLCELFVHEPSRPTVVILALILMGVIGGDFLRRYIDAQRPPPPPGAQS